MDSWRGPPDCGRTREPYDPVASSGDGAKRSVLCQPTGTERHQRKWVLWVRLCKATSSGLWRRPRSWLKRAAAAAAATLKTVAAVATALCHLPAVPVAADAVQTPASEAAAAVGPRLAAPAAVRQLSGSDKQWRWPHWWAAIGGGGRTTAGRRSSAAGGGSGPQQIHAAASGRSDRRQQQVATAVICGAALGGQRQRLAVVAGCSGRRRPPAVKAGRR